MITSLFAALDTKTGKVIGQLNGRHRSIQFRKFLDKIDAEVPPAQRVRRCDRRFDLHQFWIAKLRQLNPPVPIWGPHHDDLDLNTFESVDTVRPRTFDRRLAFERHAERGEKSDSGCKVVDDDADVNRGRVAFRMPL